MNPASKTDILKHRVHHIDITAFDSTPIIESYEKMAFQARNLARAAKIADMMVKDNDSSIILCLAGSLFSAGLKNVVHQMLECNMVDVIVSSGALVVDQDFFEALGFRHYQGTQFADDHTLMNNMIDRIYDTYISEEELRICDATIKEIADGLSPGPYSSREFMKEMGKYLDNERNEVVSVVLEAYRKGVPIFVPAFSDCSGGLGLVVHQWEREKKDGAVVSIDSAKDFLEFTKIKLSSTDTGLIMLGGGVPKNFAQDVPVAAALISQNVSMHKYAIQITVADQRDGGLSGSTLKEAHSWGKIREGFEQMVFSEATIAFPLLASYLYHQGNWKGRKAKHYNALLDKNDVSGVTS